MGSLVWRVYFRDVLVASLVSEDAGDVAEEMVCEIDHVEHRIDLL